MYIKIFTLLFISISLFASSQNAKKIIENFTINENTGLKEFKFKNVYYSNPKIKFTNGCSGIIIQKKVIKKNTKLSAFKKLKDYINIEAKFDLLKQDIQMNLENKIIIIQDRDKKNSIDIKKKIIKRYRSHGVTEHTSHIYLTPFYLFDPFIDDFQKSIKYMNQFCFNISNKVENKNNRLSLHHLNEARPNDIKKAITAKRKQINIDKNEKLFGKDYVDIIKKVEIKKTNPLLMLPDIGGQKKFLKY